MKDQYWIPFRIHEEGCKTVVEGPYSSRDAAMKAREKMKRTSIPLKEYVGVPFLANSQEEAEERAPSY